MLVKDFGLRLRKERNRLGLTQANFARIGGVEPNAQGHYESGWRNPKADYLQRVGGAGVDLMFLLTKPTLGPHEQAVVAKRILMITEPDGYIDGHPDRKSMHDLFDPLRISLQASAQAISNAAHIFNPAPDTASDLALQNEMENLITASVKLLDAAFLKAIGGRCER
jgi:transcriptional regulator with XRE-family HTH domain